jgi:DivIVA domain-containing protein
MPDSLWQARHATIDGMVHALLLLLGALVVGAVAFAITWVITGRDRGLDPEEPDGRGVPLPSSRPLRETDIETVRFDITLRGYRMDQVDAALRRSAYDLGYKTELIEVLEAEISALRDGRTADAEELRAARQSAQATGRPPVEDPAGAWNYAADGPTVPATPADPVERPTMESTRVSGDAGGKAPKSPAGADRGPEADDADPETGGTVIDGPTVTDGTEAPGDGTPSGDDASDDGAQAADGADDVTRAASGR